MSCFPKAHIIVPMPVKKDNTRESNGRWFTSLAFALLGSGIGAGSSSYIYFSSPLAADNIQAVVRPDPFTGSQAKALTGKIDAMTRQLALLERRVDKLPPREVTEEIALLRQEISFLREDLKDHLGHQ